MTSLSLSLLAGKTVVAYVLYVERDANDDNHRSLQ